MKKKEFDRLSGQILDASITVHKEMGPGLLESVYEYCLTKELHLRGFRASNQVYFPLHYKGEKLDKGVKCIPPGVAKFFTQHTKMYTKIASIPVWWCSTVTK